MKQIYSSRIIEVPSDVTASVKSRKVTVKGKYGELSRCFNHIPLDIRMVANGKKIAVNIWQASGTQMAAVGTVCTHIRKMIIGVTRKYQYKMRLVYAHFPISAKITEDGKEIVICNFLGEKRDRAVKMLPGVRIDRSKDVKDELILSGSDLEGVSRSAALIHQCALVKRKDIRKFLDGIYVSEKGNVDLLPE